ncbi:melanoma-associated antigen B16-like [Sorex araneus]|uniref:melanoma-associated antigen B16-like n=1 Tax=Sorex araneus TaxID=42254 RepID=UPI002433BC81|nr:melanoma-associated antigen B16-like [Sorex araneus]
METLAGAARARPALLQDGDFGGATGTLGLGGLRSVQAGDILGLNWWHQGGGIPRISQDNWLEEGGGERSRPFQVTEISLSTNVGQLMSHITSEEGEIPGVKACRIRPDSFLKTPSSKVIMSNSRTPKNVSLTFEPNFNIQNEIEMDYVEVEQVGLPNGTERAEEEEDKVKEEEGEGQQELEQEKQKQQEYENYQEGEEEEEQMEGEDQEQEQEKKEKQDMSADFVLNLSNSSVSSDLSSVIWRESVDSCSFQESDDSSSHMSIDSWSSFSLDSKVIDLVQFIIFKYRLKDPIITMEEMLEVITDGHEQFPVIFKKASKCLEVICGIDIKEVDSNTQSYVLFDSLSLTYDGILSDKESMPNKGLLVIVLGVIFIEGNCAHEEDMWDFLNIIGVYAGRSHFIYGEPMNLLTREWVQENYLEYKQVPNSAPPCYNFLWGPRAYAEINKLEVMQFLIKIKITDPTSFLFWYRQAMKDEEKKIRNMVHPRDSTTALRTAHLSESPAPTEE